MPRTITRPPEQVLRESAHRLTGAERDYDPLLRLIGDARIVLLGEASHGTHEFYRERARISRRLIEEQGFTAVAVEADWPDAYRVNRWVRGASADEGAVQALDDFERFPRWMWRNHDVLDFIEWLRLYNNSRPRMKPKVGFYGLDLYSLYSSIEAVLSYLEQVTTRPLGELATAMAASSTSRKTPRRTAMRLNSALRHHASKKPSGNWWSFDVRPPSSLAATAAFRKTSTSTPSRTLAW